VEVVGKKLRPKKSVSCRPRGSSYVDHIKEGLRDSGRLKRENETFATLGDRC